MYLKITLANPKLEEGKASARNIKLQDMGCETKGHCKHTWELGRVILKVAEVVVGM